MSDNGDGTLDLETNSISDHNLWVQANIGYVEEQAIRGKVSFSEFELRKFSWNIIFLETWLVTVPKNPALVDMTTALNQPTNFRAEIGFATNGVAIRNPKARNTCCDHTLLRAQQADYCQVF